MCFTENPQQPLDREHTGNSTKLSDYKPTRLFSDFGSAEFRKNSSFFPNRRMSIPISYRLVLKGECSTLWAQNPYLRKLSPLLIRRLFIDTATVFYHPWLKAWEPILQIRGTPSTWSSDGHEWFAALLADRRLLLSLKVIIISPNRKKVWQ